MQRKFTSENIQELKENEIFVFGSNLNGNHAGGAAKIAVDKFGAIEGQAEGIQGQSYAIPTLDKEINKISLEEISKSLDAFIIYAEGYSDKSFYVTKIGCGIAGFELSEIAPLFKQKNFPLNVCLPEEFCVTKGYKVFNPDMTCRGFQYEVGKEYKTDKAICCDSGFHFCEKLIDCYDYYDYDKNNKVAEVEIMGYTHTDDGKKFATNHIRIAKEILWEEVDRLVNIGAGNTGRGNSGDLNSGDRNSGDLNSGDRNSGDLNSGDRNSGYRNSGDRNSGDRNSGDLNSGDLNSGYRNSGVFCTKKRTDTVPFFNKESNMTWDDWYQHPAYKASFGLTLTEWVNWDKMTDDEKQKHPKAYVCEGYLKTYSFHEAWGNLWEKLLESERNSFKTLPNFDKDIFKEVTGVEI